MIVFHRTSAASKAAILATLRFTSRENGEVCVSNVRDGYASGYGEAVVTLNIPDDLLVPDDEFQTGETHYRVRAKNIRPEMIVSE